MVTGTEPAVDLKKLKKEQKKKEKLEKFEKKVVFNKNHVKNDKNIQKAVDQKIYYVIPTKIGDKKDVKSQFPDKYHPTFVEASWYSWWEKSNFFSPEYSRSLSSIKDMKKEDLFVMLLPPPNVTGTLHLGHALMCAIQDSLIRWSRMMGKCVLWIPGCDHAGIATQVVVEKKLKRERGVSRHDIGRDSFIEEVYKWKDEKGHIIYDQMKRLGISIDWTRAFFTMDDNRSRAVSEAFVQLHNRNKIYRHKRLINWSCSLKSAISDIEVDKVEIKGKTYFKIPNYNEKIEFGTIVKFDYKIIDSEDVITVATTRLETMLGDVAIAVNPNDDRYRHLVGKKASHPFCDRILDIISDTEVEINFGTGAVKITPAHDPVDYEIGKRQKLQTINIFDDSGYIVRDLKFYKEFEHLSGLGRFSARKIIENLLINIGLFREKLDHTYVVPFCSRSGDVVESLLKSQWFVDCSSLAVRSKEAVISGELKIIPQIHEKTWFNWMNNIQNWCISRQLWWGHRIPAYYVTSPKLPDSDPDNGYFWVSAINLTHAYISAEKKFNIPAAELTLTHDEDVLDTWFSSGLLPFSCCDWPDNTLNFKSFFPSSVLETGYDILFFWAARMVMLSLELTDSLPFHTILLHSIVRDSHGRKMSKSLGNIIDPIDVIEGITLESLNNKLGTYNLDKNELDKAIKGQAQDFKDGIPESGSDALRFTLCSYSGSKKDINLDVLRVRGYRTFCNKVWNATRFCLNNLGENFYPQPFNFNSPHLTIIDKWILSRLDFTSQKANKSFSEYDLTEATSAIYQFWLYNLCDVYIESLKPIFNSGDLVKINNARNVMFTVFDHSLRLLHPFMPFITEELYQRLPFGDEHFLTKPSICVSAYPNNLSWYNADIEQQIEVVLSTINLIRSTKDNYMPSKTKVKIFLHSNCKDRVVFMKRFELLIKTLCNASELIITNETADIPKGCVIAPNGTVCDIYIVIKDVINIESEINKNSTKMKSAQSSLEKLRLLAADQEYTKNVPIDVQESNLAKIANYESEIQKLESIIKSLIIAE